MKRSILVLGLMIGCSGKVDSEGPAADSSISSDTAADTALAEDTSTDTGTTVDTSSDAADSSAEVGHDADAMPDVAIDTPCVPKTCVGVGAECGTIDDGCGGVVTCAGSCTDPKWCGGGGAPNKCGCKKTGNTITGTPTVISLQETGVMWSNPERGKTSDDSWATASLAASEVTMQLWARGFGLSVPSFATITGATVGIEKSSSVAGALLDDSVRLFSGGIILDSADRATTSPWATSDATTSYGGASDTWGTTLAPDRVSSSAFGPLISVKSTAAAEARIDAITVTLHYDVPSCPE
jgi:hypothetical protein